MALSALEIQRKACPAEVCWCVRKVVKSGERPKDHAYTYDADNRITRVYTTTATPIVDPAFGQASAQNEPELNPMWDKEAEYSYYAHGPLARTLLGDQEVQGVDYVYTLQG